MKRIVALGLLVVGGLSLTVSSGGCARPGEFGWTPAYTFTERRHIIARNWDYEGKQTQDDIDNALMLRPASHLTFWNVR